MDNTPGLGEAMEASYQREKVKRLEAIAADAKEVEALRARVKRLEDMLLCQQCDEPGSGIMTHRTLGDICCPVCDGTGLRMLIINRHA